MKHNILSYALCLLLTMPCLLHAEEIEIQVMEVIQTEGGGVLQGKFVHL